jgi:hypothetical protein
MTSYLLTYDIQEKAGVHTALKNYLKSQYHWNDRILADDNKYYDLPNTTLIKYSENFSTDQGSLEFKASCLAVGAKWEKYIVVDWTHATFNNQ